MLVTFWTLGNILVDFSQLCLGCLWDGTLLTVPALVVTFLLFLLTYICWKTTDTPSDIPSPPRPPFLITIRPSTTTPTQNTLQDIRIFSPQPYLSRLIHQIHRSRQRTPENGVPGQESNQNVGATAPLIQPARPFHLRGLFRPAHFGSTRSFRTFLRSRLFFPVLLYRIFPRQRHQGAGAGPGPGQRIASERVTQVDRSTQAGLRVAESSQPTTDILLNSSPTPAEARVQSQGEETLVNGGGDNAMADDVVTPEGQLVKFTIKFLNDTQLEVVTSENEKIGPFKKRHFSQELKEKKIVRLIFNGRVLDENLTLKEAGIFEECVVHCLTVTPHTPPQADSVANGSESVGSTGGVRNPNTGGGGEPGFFFVSLLGIILISLWFICFNFGQQLFTQSAVVSLSVLTGIFLIGVVAFYLPVHPIQNRQ